MYKIYTDKKDVFVCQLKLDGIDESQAKARLVLEGEKYNLSFDGVIEDGVCTILLNRIGKLMEGQNSGKIKLEVLAEETYFTPWESKFTLVQEKTINAFSVLGEGNEEKEQIQKIIEDRIKSNKKRDVEISSIVDNKIHSEVEEINEVSDKLEAKIRSIIKEDRTHAQILHETLIKVGFNMTNLHENKNRLSRIIVEYVTTHDVKGSAVDVLRTELLALFTKEKR